METSAKPHLSEDERVAPFFDPDKPRLAVRTVKGISEGTARTEIRVGNHPLMVTDEPITSGGTETGPTPLETVLAGLVGCKAVMIHNVAHAMKFEYEGLELDAAGSIDLRGPKGVPGIRPYFETVDLNIVIFTGETEDRVNQLAKNAENRCPVMNMMRDAGTQVNANWTVK